MAGEHAPATVRSFNRYELKYLVHASRRGAIVDDVLRQMAPDRHGDAAGSYIISSLYFDSPDLQLLRSKVIGSRYRRKLRIRVYGESADLDRQAMVEIKQRLGRTTQKRRVILPLRGAVALCTGQHARAWNDPIDEAVASEIQSLVLGLGLRPACTISYRRCAFVGGRFEPGLRVTFDSDIWSAPPRLDFFTQPPAAFLIPRDWSILEIKVDDRVPRWILELVTRHGCQLRRVSKYCLGMITLHARQLPVGHWPTSDDVRRLAAQVVAAAIPKASPPLVSSALA